MEKAEKNPESVGPLISLSFEHNVPYLEATAKCPFCEEVARFQCMESWASHLKPIGYCFHAESTGFWKGDRVVRFIENRN